MTSEPDRSISTRKMITNPIRMASATGAYGKRLIRDRARRKPIPMPEEAPQQDEIREVREVDDVRAGPADERQLHEEHQAAQEDQAEGFRHGGQSRCADAPTA